MSSDLQSIVEALLFNNYLSVALVTAVTYDYIITFPDEINYVWNRPWTFVSAMFMFVRYTGLTVALIDGLFGSTFVPGPPLASMVLLIADTWLFVIFLAAADIVMILRVYAMYSRSKIVLGVLLVFYATTIILYAISAGFYNNPNISLSMTTPQVLNMSFCNPTYTITNMIGFYKLVPRLILAGLLLTLAVARLCTESYQAYKVTKRWQGNQYLNLLVREGVLYFVAHLLYIINFGTQVPAMVMETIFIALMYVLTPRFIMNVRELHLRQLLRMQDNGIDTGFGLWDTQSSRVPAHAVSSVGFVHSESSGTTEGDVEMQVVRSDADRKHDV